MHQTPRVAFDGNGTVTIAGLDGPYVLRWRRSARARRLCLRNGAKGIELVVPDGAPLSDAGSFAANQINWISRQMARTPEPTQVTSGGRVPFRGRDLTVVHRTDSGARGPAGERVVWCETDELHVRGEALHLPRRVEDWMRCEARRHLSQLAHEKAVHIRRTPRRITVRDTASRWGSCSADRALSFSWRLVMAPHWVLDYVVAHEVAHLRHMNHGPRFWRQCAALVAPCEYAPEQTIDRARGWLRQNGASLHAVRFRD